MYRGCHTKGRAAGMGAAFGNFYAQASAGPHSVFKRPKYNVPLNILEQDGGYEVHIYALGFEKEHIKISVVEDILYISGNKKIEESHDPNFIYQEFPVKTFERTVRLRGEIEKSGISARQEGGILKITLPKTAQAQQPAQDIKVD